MSAVLALVAVLAGCGEERAARSTPVLGPRDAAVEPEEELDAPDDEAAKPPTRADAGKDAGRDAALRDAGRDAAKDDAIAADDAAVAAPPTKLGPLLVGESVALAALASPVRPRALPFYGTDLGWTFPHDGELWVMFGDTWQSFLGDSIQAEGDDALGKISLATFPDGDSVERWVKARPPAAGKPSWHAEPPTMSIVVDASGKAQPMLPVRDGVTLTSGPGLTPMAGFSNMRAGQASGAFGLFLQNEPVQCDARGVCADGYDCDAQLGQCAPVTDVSAPCLIGSKTCNCVAVGTKRGLCQDRGSSVYDDSERGRTHSVLMRQQVGVASRKDHTRFPSREWDTRRFYNATARTVRDFDPSQRGSGDYRPADGKSTVRDGVFVWGRPNFGGVHKLGRDAQLYLAWVPMPVYDERGRFEWKPRYFAGLDAAGKPRFVDHEVDSAPLDLDASRDGVQPEEVKDMVGQMNVSWVPELNRWVMLYGGGIGKLLSELIFGSDLPALDADPLGSLWIRQAPDPWGPWSAPEPFMIGGAPERGIVGQFGPGGILHAGTCQGPTCAPGELTFVLQDREWGRLYAPAIIEPWLEPRTDGSVDFYWNVSTWNPYQVLLMKTNIRAQ